MAAAKNCPRCGTALKITGDKFVCPSCRVSLVRKTKGDTQPDPRIVETPPSSAPLLDFTAQPVAPSHPSTTGLGRGLVLGGAALFLLLGTVLTGYAFALTFSTPTEPPPVSVVQSTEPKPQPKPPEPPSEDWRTTLSNLRELVETPPTTLTQTPTTPKPAGPPPRVNKVIDKGVEYLKTALRGAGSNGGALRGRDGPGAAALGGLTLLECGVPADDASIRHVVTVVRKAVPTLTQTYDITTCIWFLDKLNQAEDKPLIRTLALRLIANQQPMGGWGYTSQVISTRDEEHLLQLLADKPLSANWRREMTASLAVDTGKPPTKTPPVRNPPRQTNMSHLPLFQWEPGKKIEWPKNPVYEDNSLSQFAVLALWAARRQGLPVERSLAFVEARFRTYQNADGSWGYKLKETQRRDSMTCAGLLGLAVGRGLGKQSDQPKGDVNDEAIEKALVYLGQIVVRGAAAKLSPAELAKKQTELREAQAKFRKSKDAEDRRKNLAEVQRLQSIVRAAATGKLVGSDAWGDLYFLWSMERMAVVYDLKTIAGKDWHAWGSELLMNAQLADGSWNEAHTAVPDTCFALLFLKRVNIVQDLTDQLRLLGKVKDPGHSRPAIVLPGDTAKPDER